MTRLARWRLCARRASRRVLAFAEFAVDVDPRLVEIAVLSDADDVEHAVDSSVAAEVESMLDR
jgi:hypothetical protein